MGRVIAYLSKQSAKKCDLAPIIACHEGATNAKYAAN